MGIALKILEVSKRIGHIEKGGTNQHFKFKFQAWDDVLPAVRDACCEVGLAVIPSTTLIDRTGDLSMLLLTVILADTESDETLTLTWVGEAKDSQDKGFQKAATSGLKYLLLKTFMIPCHGDDDPEADGPEEKPKAKTTGKAQASVEAQAPVVPAQKSPADVKAPETGGETLQWAMSIMLAVGEFADASEVKLWWKPLAQQNVSAIHFAKVINDRGITGREAITALAQEFLQVPA